LLRLYAFDGVHGALPSHAGPYDISRLHFGMRLGLSAVTIGG
jgi:hypothetical protein